MSAGRSYGPADAIVRRAAARWPVEMRDDMAAEWLAELAAMRRENVSRWRRITYAVSLLVSAPVEEPGRPPRVWREEFPSIGRAAAQLLALAAVAFGAVFAASEVPTFARFLLLQAQDEYPGGNYYIGEPTTIQWAANGVSIAALVLTCAGFVWLGRRLGRVMPLRWARYIGVSSAGPGVIAALSVGAALAAAFVAGVDSLSINGGPTPVGRTQAIPAVAAWTVLAMVTAGFAVRFAVRRRTIAVTVGVFGSLVALDIVSLITVGGSPLWFPLSLLDLERSGIPYADPITYFGNVNAVAAVVRPMLVCAAFLLAYALRAAQVRPVEPKLRPVAVPVGRQLSASVFAPIRHSVSVGLMIAGLALWAYSAAIVTPAIEAINEADSDNGELRLWIQEQRELAIWLIVVALILAMLRRGPIALPATIAYIGMFVTDCVVDYHGFGGQHTFVAMVLIGVALLAGAWWLCARISLRPADPIETRRVATAIAIMAALTSPVLSINFSETADFHHVPSGLIPAACAIMGLVAFGAVAMACSVGRVTAAPRRVVMAYTLGPLVLVLFLIFGRTGQDEGVPLVLAPVLCLLVLAAVSGRGRITPWRWIVFGIASVPAAVVYFFGSIIVAMPIAGGLMAAAGFEYPSDGVPMFPGALLVGIGIGSALAWTVIRQPRPQPVPIESTVSDATAILLDGMLRGIE